MTTRKKVLVIIGVSIVAITIVVVGYNYTYLRGVPPKSVDEVIEETTMPESTYSSKIDDGPVKVGEEIKIEVPEATSNDSINMEVNPDMSNFKSNAHKEEASGLTVKQDQAIHTKTELTADIDWSDFELTDSEYREMLSIGARLVEIEMNESGKYGAVKIQPVIPNSEEIKGFTAPIMYIVSEDGILTMNTKLQITNETEGTYKEVLTPVSVYYEGNVVKLKK